MSHWRNIDMVGESSLRSRASSTQSNLSHLAPPFTSSRSGSNLKTSPQSILDSYIPSQSAPATPLPDSLSPFNRDMGIARSYDCLGPHYAGSRGTHLPSLSHKTNDFLYWHQSQSVGNDAVEADPSYLQEPSVTEDSNSSSLNPSGFVILDSGVSAPIEGHSKTAYVQSSTGCGCKPSWVGQWNDVGADISSKESKGMVNLLHRSSIQPGATNTESYLSNKKSHVWHENLGVPSTEKVYAGSTRALYEWMDTKHSRVEANCSLSYSSKPQMSSVLVPSTMQERKYSHETNPSVLAPLTDQEIFCSDMLDLFSMKSWDFFNQNTVSSDGCITPLESCKIEPAVFCSSTAFPSNFCSSVTTESIPYASGSCLLLGKEMLKDKKFISQLMNTCNKSDSVRSVSVRVRAPPGSTAAADVSTLSNSKREYVNESMETSAGCLSSNQEIISDNSLSELPKKGIEVDNLLKVPEASIHLPSIGRPSDSLQSPDALDRSLSALDSPCWKGTSLNSSRKVAVAESTKFLKEESKSVNPECAESSFSPEACSDVSNYSKVVVENSSFKIINPSLVCSLTAELELDVDKKAESDCFKDENSDEADCNDGLYVRSNSPASNSGVTSNVMTLGIENVFSTAKAVPRIIIKEPSTVSNASKDVSSGLNHYMEQISIPSNKSGTVNEGGKTFQASSTSYRHFSAKLDASISMLVKSIHCQSELLKFYGDANALKENDYRVLDLVINNLSGVLRQSPNLRAEFDSSYRVRASTDTYKGSTIGTHQAAEGLDNLSVGDHQSILCSEGTMQSTFRSRIK